MRNDIANVLLRYAVFRGQLPLKNIANRITDANLFRDKVIDLMFNVPILFDHICYVLGLSAKKQVFGIDAERNVASVAYLDLRRDGSAIYLPSDAVRKFATGETPIPADRRAYPNPTSLGLMNSIEQPTFYRSWSGQIKALKAAKTSIRSRFSRFAAVLARYDIPTSESDRTCVHPTSAHAVP